MNGNLPDSPLSHTVCLFLSFNWAHMTPSPPACCQASVHMTLVWCRWLDSQETYWLRKRTFSGSAADRRHGDRAVHQPKACISHLNLSSVWNVSEGFLPGTDSIHHGLLTAPILSLRGILFEDLLFLDSALFPIDGTLCPECVGAFSDLNGCGFLSCTGFVVWQTDAAGPRLSHLWSSDVKTRHVRGYVPVFLWENHYVVKTGAPGEGSSLHHPQGNAFYNSAKFGPGLSPVGGQGWSATPLVGGWDFNVYLPKVWTATSVAPLLNIFV